MSNTRTMTVAAAIAAKRMYEERDGRGRRKWSCLRLARHFCVGESTMYRVLNSAGGYMDLPDAPLTKEAMDSGAEASLRKFLTQNPDLAPEGALEQLEQTAAEKMAAAIREEREKAGRGDALLSELVNPKGKEE